MLNIHICHNLNSHLKFKLFILKAKYRTLNLKTILRASSKSL